jgi:PAS domain S-box-containing protein
LDIKEGKKMEETLQKNYERYHALVQNSSEGIWCFELEQPIAIALPVNEQIDLLYRYACMTDANDALALMYGYEKGNELIGFRIEDFFPRSDPDSISSLKKHICDLYRSIDWETVGLTRQGKRRIFSANTFGIIQDGYLLRTWGLQRDITEQRQTEKKLLESRNDLQKLTGRLITAQEEELSRLARELHDDLTQRLAVMSIEAGKIEQRNDLPGAVLQQVSQIKEQLIKTSKDVHNMSRNLHPSILQELGLERTIRSECNSFSSRTGIAVIFIPKDIPLAISNDISLSIYRIIQEGLSNISKHAHTKNAYIFLEGMDRAIQLSIRDTGTGFDPEKVRNKSSLGLGSMRERVRHVHGKFSITSRLGKGTNIEVEIPLKERV